MATTTKATETLSCCYLLLATSQLLGNRVAIGYPVNLLPDTTHHPTGGVLEADLSPHGSIRSAGTREYR